MLSTSSMPILVHLRADVPPALLASVARPAIKVVLNCHSRPHLNSRVWPCEDNCSSGFVSRDEGNSCNNLSHLIPCAEGNIRAANGNLFNFYHDLVPLWDWQWLLCE